MQWLLRGIRPWESGAGERPCKLVLDLGDGIFVEGHCDRVANGGALLAVATCLNRQQQRRSSSGRQDQDRSQAPRETCAARRPGDGQAKGRVLLSTRDTPAADSRCGLESPARQSGQNGTGGQ